jgi:hypothetical protein
LVNLEFQSINQRVLIMDKIDQIIVGVSLTGFVCLMFIIALWG